ncbi:MAG: hydrogenase-4 component E [Desulfovibrionaceae bacterium]|nr:hydrogenase-4 component E [Desulfovibrionaceae bacterium]
MSLLLQIAIVLLLLGNLAMLAARRLEPRITLVALQGALLAALLLLAPHNGGHLLHSLLLAAAIIAIKAVSFPLLLRRTLRKVSFTPHAVSASKDHKFAVLAGMAGLIFSLWLETRLPLAQALYPPLLFPAALTTLFAGLIMVVGRNRALGQVMGYLVAENGIFLLSMPLMVESSTWFELSLLLDVFVAVFVMGIAINHINETFESIDVGRFCSLRD